MKLRSGPARVLVVALLAASAGCATLEAPATTYEAGLAAYERGDHDGAYDIWRSLSTAGDARASYRLGDLFDYGTGVDQDYELAALYYRRAAERGHADAQFQLAGRYNDGLGVRKNRLKSLTWYMIALDNRNLSHRNRELAQRYLRSYHSVCVMEKLHCRELQEKAQRLAAAWQAKTD